MCPWVKTEWGSVITDEVTREASMLTSIAPYNLRIMRNLNQSLSKRLDVD
jgi:hypothetical protein